MTVLLRWGPPFLWMAVIFALSSQSRPPAAVREAPDWLLHGIAYGLLAALWLRAWTGRLRAPGTAPHVFLAVFLIAAAYGVSDEFHQSFVPGRSPEARDVLADAVGAALALAALRCTAGRLPAATA